jgi:hypothetical protein
VSPALYRIIIETMLIAMGSAGMVFLTLLYSRGFPGKALDWPRGLRLLFALALTGSPLATIFYAVLGIIRWEVQHSTVQSGLGSQLTGIAIVAVVGIPTFAKLTTLLWVRKRMREGQL